MARSIRTYSNGDLVKLAAQVGRKLARVQPFTAEERRLDALSDVIAKEARRRGLTAALAALHEDDVGIYTGDGAVLAPPEPAPKRVVVPRRAAAPPPPPPPPPPVVKSSPIEVRNGKFCIVGTDKWFGTREKAEAFCRKAGLALANPRRNRGRRRRRNAGRFAIYSATSW